MGENGAKHYSKQNKTKQNKTKQNKTKQNKTSVCFYLNKRQKGKIGFLCVGIAHTCMLGLCPRIGLCQHLENWLKGLAKPNTKAYFALLGAWHTSVVGATLACQAELGIQVHASIQAKCMQRMHLQPSIAWIVAWIEAYTWASCKLLSKLPRGQNRQSQFSKCWLCQHLAL